MKVVKSNENNVIAYDKVTTEMFVVGKAPNSHTPRFMLSSRYYKSDVFVPLCVDSGFTHNNSFGIVGYGLSQAIDKMLEYGYEVNAFHTFDEAAKWLIDNK